jgi:SET domain-containing protein
MFLIPTYLAPSAIHGMGVFTPVAIPKGTRIWEYNPSVDWKITKQEMALIPEPHQARLRTYCFLDDHGLYVLCGDNARFMNHVDNPNCDDSGKHFTMTRNDIQAHEELTCDYRTFDNESAPIGSPLYQPAKAK